MVRLQSIDYRWIFTIVDGENDTVTMFCHRCGSREVVRLQPGDELCEDDKAKVVVATDAFKHRHHVCKTEAN